MRIVHQIDENDIAQVFVGELADGSRVEFVDSTQPPQSREMKWVLIVSTLKGCPVTCPICDAGGSYAGRLTSEEILGQVAHMIHRRYPDGNVPARKLKIQFARMGDPALNDAVLDVLRQIPERFDVPGFMPCISTIAPAGREHFFEELLAIKKELFSEGRFQLQFSVHSTDENRRHELIPAKIWSFREIADYGTRFYQPGDRKITLNFAPADQVPMEPDQLQSWFPPDRYLVKLTPINPTKSALLGGFTGLIDPEDPEGYELIARRFEAVGYETIVSIGELKENEIGSNCGMFVQSSRALQREGQI